MAGNTHLSPSLLLFGFSQALIVVVFLILTLALARLKQHQCIQAKAAAGHHLDRVDINLGY